MGISYLGKLVIPVLDVKGGKNRSYGCFLKTIALIPIARRTVQNELHEIPIYVRMRWETNTRSSRFRDDALTDKAITPPSVGEMRNDKLQPNLRYSRAISALHAYELTRISHVEWITQIWLYFGRFFRCIYFLNDIFDHQNTLNSKQVHFSYNSLKCHMFVFFKSMNSRVFVKTKKNRLS